MDNNARVDIIKWQIGFVVTAIVPIIGIYAIQRTENNYVTGISPIIILGGYCFGGFIILFGIVGAIYCLFQINKSSEKISSRVWITTFVIPILIWLILVVAVSIRPFNLDQLIFQEGIGSSNFQKIDMEQADFSSMDFFNADFTGANLRKSNLSYTNFKYANLQGADLKGANLLDVELQDANLYEAIIDHDQLIFALSLRGATMPDGTRYDGRFFIGSDLTVAVNENINLCDPSQMAIYYGITESEYLRGLNWASKNLPGYLQGEGRSGNQLNKNYSWVNLNEANLRGSNFYGAGLNGVIFSFANLNNADMSGSDLSFANMCNASLRGTNLTNAQIDYVDFRGADLFGADLTGSSMIYSNLTNANIAEDQIIEVNQLQGTILPDGREYNGGSNLQEE